MNARWIALILSTVTSAVLFGLVMWFVIGPPDDAPIVPVAPAPPSIVSDAAATEPVVPTPNPPPADDVPAEPVPTPKAAPTPPPAPTPFAPEVLAALAPTLPDLPLPGLPDLPSAASTLPTIPVPALEAGPLPTPELPQPARAEGERLPGVAERLPADFGGAGFEVTALPFSPRPGPVWSDWPQITAADWAVLRPVLPVIPWMAELWNKLASPQAARPLQRHPHPLRPLAVEAVTVQ